MNSIKILEIINETNIVNFLIMAGVLYWILKKINVNSILEKGVDSINKIITESDDTKKRSQKKHELSVLKLEKLPQKIKEMQDFNKQKEVIFEEKINQSTQKNIEKIKSNVEKVIDIEEKKISADLTQITMQNSITKARDIVTEKLKTNPKLHEAFINESLAEFEKAVI